MSKINIILEGATGRLGRTQHLRALLAIRNEGGLVVENGIRLVPEPILLGRNPDKLSALATAHGITWSTDREACLADPNNIIYFDVSASAGRADRARAAIAAGKHIYLEKPIAESLEDALSLFRLAERANVKHGVVQDKLFLPGLHKLRRVRDSGFLGTILSAKLDFGWWIFDGTLTPAQRSSWNYRKRDGGGIVLDMFPHWRYIVDHLIGPMASVACRVSTQVRQRYDEQRVRYNVDVEDAALATIELESGVLGQIASSWATRVRRDDMLTLQVDGTHGSVVCGLHRCYVQSSATTPSPLWNIEAEREEDFDKQWQEVPDIGSYGNSYRLGWELFLRHVVDGSDFPSSFLEGAKGIQLVDACYRSDVEKRWIDLPSLLPEDVLNN